MKLANFAYRLAMSATLLAFIVILLGAYTRLKDAGLGCPDWPGCYGHLVLPKDQQILQQAQQLYPKQIIEPGKAWIEMIHRYVAGTLGIIIGLLAILSFNKNPIPGHSRLISVALLGMVVFQAILGMWTVTWQVMPVIVMSHLLGGLTLLALLWWLTLRLGHYAQGLDLKELHRYRIWAGIGLLIIILQIFLGGWTSTNYAALICPDFPTCQAGFWLPQTNWRDAYNFFTPIGPDYQGGWLNTGARITIQMMHRLGALITSVYLGSLAFWLWLKAPTGLIRHLVLLISALLLLQLLLGILNVLWLLPISVALAHNGIAALLLLEILTLNYCLYRK